MKKVITIFFVIFAIFMSGCTTSRYHSECSTDNSPKIYVKETPGYKYNAVDFCGTKTEFEAIDLYENNLILYVEKNGSGQIELKTISTISPFEERLVGVIPEDYYLFNPNPGTGRGLEYNKEYNVYFNEIQGELCGSSYSVFVFSPDENSFLIGGNNDNCGKNPLTFISSSGEFTAKDIKFTSESYSEICWPESTPKTQNFSNDFVEKIYCTKNSDIVGYFDLINDKFVQEEDDLEGNMYEDENILTNQEVYDLIAGHDNENPKFSSLYGGSQIDQYIDESTIINFLEKMGLSSLAMFYPNYDEIDAYDRYFTKEICDELRALRTREYFGEEGLSYIFKNCESSYNNLITKKLTPNQIFLSVNKAGDFGSQTGIVAAIYNLNDQSIQFLPVPASYSGTVYNEDEIYYFNNNELISSYNISKDSTTAYTGQYNKSHKWQIVKNNSHINLLSFNGDASINLGDIPSDYNSYMNDDALTVFEKKYFFNYFEINDDNTKFALPVYLSHKDKEAIILYGDLVNNGLKEAKSIKIGYAPFETTCWASANSTMFLIDNLLVTFFGCPVVFETTVFDMGKNEFLFRSGNLLEVDNLVEEN